MSDVVVSQPYITPATAGLVYARLLERLEPSAPPTIPPSPGRRIAVDAGGGLIVWHTAREYQQLTYGIDGRLCGLVVADLEIPPGHSRG